jgi:L,D-transpeptidase ErfK/SrfK
MRTRKKGRRTPELPTAVLAIGVLLAAVGAARGPRTRPSPPTGFEALPRVLGEPQLALVEPGDTLLDIAYRHFVGHDALTQLNPRVDPWIPKPGTVVRLPTRSIPPRAAPEGLVVNVPAMRLYDFTVAGGPEVFHVAVGDAVDPTILGAFRVGEKRAEPFWYVPESIQREKPDLPAVVPPGADNPLGDRWMTVGRTSYGIHGTNNPWSIGREATHGCIRLYDEEMRRLYERTRPGTRLQIVYQPYTWGREGDGIFLEAHPDLYARIERPLDAALAWPRELGLEDALDLARVTAVLAEARGEPVRVGTRPAPAESGEPGASATSAPTS